MFETRSVFYQAGDRSSHGYSLPDERRDPREIRNPFAKNQLLGSFERTMGIESMHALAVRLEDEIMQNPAQVHLLGAVGEPLSSKSLTLRMIVGWVLRPEGKVTKELVEKRGYNIRTDIVPWGDPFLTLPKEEQKPKETL